jgi:deazaflavin-dependent oxidoreductase (nitroreductase family)
MTNDTTGAALTRVAEYEAGLRGGTVANRLLRWLGPRRPFVALYRRLGPRVDPWLLRSTGGLSATKLYGFPLLLLVTKGAKTGKRRTSPLLYVREGNDFFIVGTNFGTEHHPAWTGNLTKHGSAEIVIGTDTLPVAAEQVDDATFARLWPRFTAVYPGYDVYLTRLTKRKPRMFRLQVSRS